MAMLLINDIFQRTWGVNLQSHGYNRPAEEFWTYTISKVKQTHKDMKFLAEGKKKNNVKKYIGISKKHY
jgi:hypothetical protein